LSPLRTAVTLRIVAVTALFCAVAHDNNSIKTPKCFCAAIIGCGHSLALRVLPEISAPPPSALDFIGFKCKRFLSRHGRFDGTGNN
jgi:hypothetical protein